MLELSGQVAHRFEILGPLGEGGMGTVFRAKDLVAGREVALKVLHAELAADRERVLEFKQEYRLLDRLRHPNTCDVYDFGTTEDGRPFMALELVEGETLEQLIPLPPARLAEILTPLGAALDFIHQQGLVHCDLKPENIRITPDGTLKLMDFGLMSVEGLSGAVKGTLAYMAPEIAREGAIDRRSDLYALGAMLYELFSGQPPFAGSPIEVLRAHLQQPVRPLRDHAPHVDEAIAGLIERMLAKEPSERPQSIGEVLRAAGLSSQAPAAPAILAGRFVGRTSERAALESAIRALQDGQGGVLWVAGQPGSGKTRLLSELRVMAQLAELPCAIGAVPDGAMPYGPFLAIIRQLLPIARARDAEAIATQLKPLKAVMPELGAPEAEPIVRDPDQERLALQRAIMQVIRLAMPQGGILAFDDWERIDDPSRELVEVLRRQLTGSPILYVGTTVDAFPADAVRMDLGPLSAVEVQTLVSSMLGRAEVPASFAAQVAELTHGTPKPIRSLIAHLAGRGVLRWEQDAWQLPERVAAAEMPQDVKSLLLASVAGLSPEAAKVAEWAALIAWPFSLALLAVLHAGEEAALFDALDELQRAGVLVNDAGSYAFSASEVPEALRERVEEARRPAAHRAIAQAMEATIGALESASAAALRALAHHRLRASDAEPAIRVTYLAAQRHGDLGASDVALGLLDEGLARLRVESAIPAQETWLIDYLILLAGRLTEKVRFEEANAALREARAIAAAREDARRLLYIDDAWGRSHLAASLSIPEARNEGTETLTRVIERAEAAGELSVRLRASKPLALSLFLRGQHDRARAVMEAAMPLAVGEGFEGYRAIFAGMLGYLQITSGVAKEQEEGLLRLKEAIAIQERFSDIKNLGQSLAFLVDAELQFGRFAAAQGTARRMREIYHQLGYREDEAIGWLNELLATLELGQLEATEGLIARLRPKAEAVGSHLVTAIVEGASALLAFHRGQPARALATLQSAIEKGQAVGGYAQQMTTPYVIETLIELGQTKRALEAAQEFQFLLRSNPSPALQTRLYLFLGEIYSRQENHAIAADFLQRALDESLAADAQGVVVEALIARARHALRRGETDEARMHAERALSGAQSGGMLVRVAQAASLLGEIALTLASPEARVHFQTVQAIGDTIGAPFFRAQGLFGQARIGARNAALILEAQKLLKKPLEELSEEARQAFATLQWAGPLLEKNAHLQEEAPLRLEDSQQIIERLQSISHDLVGVAGQYGQLFQGWSAKSAQLEMLNALASKINASLDLEAVLAQVVQLTLQLTKAERGFLLLLDGTTTELVCRAAYDHFGRAIPHEAFSRSTCEKVLASQEAAVILDASLDEDFNQRQSIAGLNLRTLMCVPLLAKGRALGVLYVDSKAVVQAFTGHDLSLLNAIASHAGIAIENARLYSDLNRHAAELELALERYRKAEHEASTDMLTGLRNRRYFQEEAARMIASARRYGTPLSLIIMDVDHFKKFNDTYGHAIGDEVLKAMGLVLPEAVRLTDVPARFGGEEFVVLAPNTDAAGAAIVAERIRTAVMEVKLQDADGKPVRQITVSLGLAELQADDQAIGELLGRADTALYACKADGRNQWQIWHPDMLPPEAQKH